MNSRVGRGRVTRQRFRGLRFRPLCVALLAVWGLLARGISSASAQPIDKQALVAEIRRGAAPMEDLYLNSVIEAQITERDWPSNPGTRTRRVTFRGAAGNLRVDYDRLSEDSEKKTAFVTRPDVSFDVGSGASSDRYLLKSVSSQYDSSLQGLRLGGGALGLLPFSMYELSLVDFLALDDLTIVGLEDEMEQGTTRRTIRFQREGKLADGKHFHASGFLAFWPERCWALREFASGKNVLVRGRFDYSEQRGDIPLLAAAEFWNENRETQERWDVRSIEVTRFDTKAPPESDFSFAAFGLPELGRPPRSHWLLWSLLAALAVILTTAGYWLKRHGQPA